MNFQPSLTSAISNILVWQESNHTFFDYYTVYCLWSSEHFAVAIEREITNSTTAPLLNYSLHFWLCN